ncbi:MAG: energy transducer TonB [Candidatus Eisenbacteria bacterium]|nr:energy transducer TonB [Candidatus Eisenbacteria bacterium]
MEVAKKYMFRATLGGIGTIAGIFVIMFVTNLIIAQQEKAIPVVQMQVSDLAAPPPLSQDTPPPQVQVSPAAAPPAAAIPVPVPDAEAPQEQTIMSQEEIATSTPGVAEAGDGQQIVVAPPSDDEMPKFGDYVYVEELPEAVTRIPPVYPDMAREANVDGTVMVQALVGKDGKVRDVRVVKSIPMLDDAAKAAVRQWVFKPALSNNKPVAVWVGVPVKFSLH